MESNPLPPAPKPTNKLSTEIAAAIITGVFGLVTVLVTTVFPRIMPERKETASPTLTAAPTLASTSSPTTTSTSEGSSDLATNVTLIGSLPAKQQDAVIAGYAAALDLANQLPLMIRDEFDSQDYGWAEAPRTEYETNYCEFKIEEGAYHILIETKNASGSCWTGAPRSAGNFLFTADLSAANPRDLTADILFRFHDWDNYYYLSLDSTHQQFSIGQYLDGKLNDLADWTSEKHINKSGMNQVSIIGAGDQITLYINQNVVAGFTDPAAQSGSILIRANLYETSASYDLVVDNVVLRGE